MYGLQISRRQVLGATPVLAGIAAIQWSQGIQATAQAESSIYTINFDKSPAQTIKGLGFEIQSDSIGSANNGLPESASSVPFDLVDSEYDRFVESMLRAGVDKPGFRYCRLALGLYLRGTDAEQKQIVERFSGQAAGIAKMISDAQIEGVDAEYWSPAPYWKSTHNFIGGTLRSTEASFYDDLSTAMAKDVTYLFDHDIPVVQWGMQNEPKIGNVNYSCCAYTDDMYYEMFRRVAPKIHAIDSDILVHVNSQDGWSGRGSAKIIADAEALTHVDAWSYHRIGYNSNYQIDNNFNKTTAHGKPVFNNEFEYLSGWRPNTVNTAQSIMNWFTFVGSPTWYWLHALKPTTNAESKGYGLGFWRPASDVNFSSNHFPDLPVGHWQFNDVNWNAVAGFIKFLPQDSVRYSVTEPVVLRDQRIMAWRAPDGTAGFVVTNRGTSPFTFTVDTQTQAPFSSMSYTSSAREDDLPHKHGSGPIVTTTVAPGTIEFWVEDTGA